jgi:hypothetical protein
MELTDDLKLERDNLRVLKHAFKDKIIELRKGNSIPDRTFAQALVISGIELAIKTHEPNDVARWLRALAAAIEKPEREITC